MDLHPCIPFDHWQPLSVDDVVSLFHNAPFPWCLAGGYAVEQFLGKRLRPHGDIDVVIFRDDQLQAQRWLQAWRLYAADKQCSTGSLRRWHPGEYLPVGIHDIWGHTLVSTAWQMQLMLQEAIGDEWYCRRNRAVGGLRREFMCHYNHIPCIRIDIQLMYKAKGLREKDQLDFQACLPQLSLESCIWLKDSLRLMFPEGHEWITALETVIQ